MAICKSCGAKIIWLTTKKNKSMPCNAAAVHYTPVEKGGMLIVSEQGNVEHGVISLDTTRKAGELVGYIPHWATCPQAARWKK